MEIESGYVTLEDAARVLGRPVSVLQGILSEGKVSAKLTGRHWLIRLRDLEKAYGSLPTPAGGSALGSTPKRPPRTPRHERGAGADPPGNTSRLASNVRREANDLDKLDARVIDLGSRLRPALSRVSGGRAVWNRVKEDDYALNPASKAALPEDVVDLLSELRKTKQRYILLRETARYKRLLRFLPGWKPKRVVKPVKVAPTKPKPVVPTKPKWQGPVVGIPGYARANIADMRYWFAEE